MRKFYALLLGSSLAVSACDSEVPPDVSPCPDQQVSGQIVDIRGEVIVGATVALSNRYDQTSTETDAEGRFEVTVDGSEMTLSSLAVHHDDYRPYDGAIMIGCAPADAGVRALVSREEIVFGTTGDDLYMLRADGVGGVLQLTDSPDTREITPRRSPSGLVIRWADVTAGEVVEASWNGSAPRVTYRVGADHDLLGIAWGQRGTFVARQESGGGAVDTIIAEDPPGTTFNYQWPGQYPDVSPPTFGFIGPEPIDGNMLVYAEDTGLATAFPYFGDQFLVPEPIAGTEPGDLYPRWSDEHAEGLDIAFVRDYALWHIRVTPNEAERRNEFSTPVPIFDTINVQRIAWSPTAFDGSMRIAFAVNVFSSGSELADPGDIAVLSFDVATGQITGAPEIVYDADAEGNPGPALYLDWR